MNVVLPVANGLVVSGLPAPRECVPPFCAALKLPTAPGWVRTLFDRGFYLMSHPDVAAAGIDPLEHFLECGLQEGRSPHPLFDPGFYAAQMPVQDASEIPFLHYLREGALNRLDPHPLFDTKHYIAQTEAGTLFGQLPLLHLLASGARDQLSPNPLFDVAYYRRANAGRTPGSRHPLLHYVETGWREGARTHPLFDRGFYSSLRPDIAAVGHDPLAHFLRHGRRETVSTHEMFDASHYRAAYRGQDDELDAIEDTGAVLHYAKATNRHAAIPPPSPHSLFQPAFYARNHRDTLQHGVGHDPFLHFLEHGLEGRQDPHPLFDSAFYARRYPDVALQGQVPLLHFIRHGALEGRDPNEFFDAARYLQRHPAAAAEPYGAVSHYLGGETRTSPPSSRFDPAYYSECLHPMETTPDLDPLSHYLATGRKAGRTPLPQPLARLAWRGTWSREHRAWARPLLLISPDAGSHPTSLCALRAVQHLAVDPGLACHVALLRGGVLEAEFAAAAPTLLLRQQRDLAELLYSFQRAAPDGIVIVNTATMPEVVVLVARLGLKLLAERRIGSRGGRSPRSSAQQMFGSGANHGGQDRLFCGGE